LTPRAKRSSTENRSLLTGGILDAALDSRVQHQPIATPELATIDCSAPTDSGFIPKPSTNPAPNWLGR
jgi:hypothetical protein